MWKTVLAGATAAVIAGSGVVFAQQSPDRDEGKQWHPSAEDISAFTDARIAGLKAGLKLTPEQEKNWPAYEAAIRDMSKSRAERKAAREDDDEDEQASDDPIERMRHRADAFAAMASGLTKLADAQEPLYDSLDDAQRYRFDILSRALRPNKMRRSADWQGHRWFRSHRRTHDRGPNKDWCDRAEHGGPKTDL